MPRHVAIVAAAALVLLAAAAVHAKPHGTHKASTHTHHHLQGHGAPADPHTRRSAHEARKLMQRAAQLEWGPFDLIGSVASAAGDLLESAHKKMTRKECEKEKSPGFEYKCMSQSECPETKQGSHERVSATHTCGMTNFNVCCKIKIEMCEGDDKFCSYELPQETLMKLRNIDPGLQPAMVDGECSETGKFCHEKKPCPKACQETACSKGPGHFPAEYFTCKTGGSHCCVQDCEAIDDSHRCRASCNTEGGWSDAKEGSCSGEQVCCKDTLPKCTAPDHRCFFSSSCPESEYTKVNSGLRCGDGQICCEDVRKPCPAESDDYMCSPEFPKAFGGQDGSKSVNDEFKCGGWALQCFQDIREPCPIDREGHVCSIVSPAAFGGEAEEVKTFKCDGLQRCYKDIRKPCPSDNGHGCFSADKKEDKYYNHRPKFKCDTDGQECFEDLRCKPTDHISCVPKKQCHHSGVQKALSNLSPLVCENEEQVCCSTKCPGHCHDQKCPDSYLLDRDTPGYFESFSRQCYRKLDGPAAKCKANEVCCEKYESDARGVC